MTLLKEFDSKTESHPTSGNAAGASSHQEGHVVTTGDVSKPFSHCARAVDDAMALLLYAAETGRTVDETTRVSILRARTAPGEGADTTVTANLLVALTRLAQELHPVTAESLKASHESLTPAIKPLRLWTWILAILIIVSSALAFVTSSLSGTIRTDITTANDLVLKLRSELGTKSSSTGGTPGNPLPKGLEGDVITQLQQYASTIRAIDGRARRLNWFVLNAVRDQFGEWRQSLRQAEENDEKAPGPENSKKLKELSEKFRFELTPGLPDIPDDLDKLTGTYEKVRSFADDILDLVSVSYGALTTCLLPVLYALLGTCAYLLRGFEEEVKHKTFTRWSRATSARLLVAVIGGTVVGLFGNFSFTQGASISPLAIAFLVGYGVDIFFSFLEGLLQALTKGKNTVLAAKPSS